MSAQHQQTLGKCMQTTNTVKAFDRYLANARHDTEWSKRTAARELMHSTPMRTSNQEPLEGAAKSTVGIYDGKRNSSTPSIADVDVCPNGHDPGLPLTVQH
jgi:hypothetical protein